MNTCCNNIYPDEDLRRWENCNSTALANPENYYTKDEIDDIIEEIEISGGSVEYSAGTGIDITDHVISCTVTGSGISSGDVQNMIDESISGKADTSAVTAVSDALTTHSANTTVHVTSQDKENWGNKLDASALNGYATQEWVEDKGYLTEHQPIKTINGISMVGTGDIEIESGGTTDLSNYYNKQEVNAIVSGKADTGAVTAVNNALTAHTSNGDIHVTSQEKSAWNGKLDASAYTPTDLSNYYTKQEIENKHYLTEHQHLKTINGNSLIGYGDIIISGGSAEGALAVDWQAITNGNITDELFDSIMDASGNKRQIYGYMDYSDGTYNDMGILPLFVNSRDYEGVTYLDLSFTNSLWTTDYLISKNGSNDYTVTETTKIAQEELQAGSGIAINGNVISATGGGSGITVDQSLDSGSTNPVVNSAITQAINAKADASNVYTKTEVNNIVNNKFWCGTQAQYEALTTKDNNVLYLIHE